MERPAFKFSSLLSLLVSAVIIGAVGGFVIGGLTDNPPAGWTFFGLSISHVVAGGIAVILTHDIE